MYILTSENKVVSKPLLEKDLDLIVLSISDYFQDIKIIEIERKSHITISKVNEVLKNNDIISKLLKTYKSEISLYVGNTGLNFPLIKIPSYEFSVMN